MTNLEEIVNLVKALPPEEQAELRRRLDALSGQPGELASDLNERAQRALYEAGLLSEIKPPITDPRPYRRDPIKIKGKPLSETVIEERRSRCGSLCPRHKCGG
jgi:hypothetical protein